MNDIVIYATSLEEHERKYNLLIERLRKANLKLQYDKCKFLKNEITYLGHVWSIKMELNSILRNWWQ